MRHFYHTHADYRQAAKLTVSLHSFRRTLAGPIMIDRTHAAALTYFNTATYREKRKYFPPRQEFFKAIFFQVERGDSENRAPCFGSSEFRNSFPRRQMKIAAMIATAPMASEI